MSRSITVEYSLRPPASSGQSYELPASRRHEFMMSEPSNTLEQPKYYKVLRETIAQARHDVGEDLTAWRDAVGKAELTKEIKKPKVDEEEEEDDADDA
ncbi:hypothetical protein B0H15DRAFT_813057 [Mycena belliarum]|uniref:Uncharacterized protein n=1 Tax=Mycena belliarum TaxID=1033014 RepID=A0AAD6XY00_9AGAR|nr:hypothetical protein B0H15DRAFT_813057 [Mycena belliae]